MSDSLRLGCDMKGIFCSVENEVLSDLHVIKTCRVRVSRISCRYRALRWAPPFYVWYPLRLLFCELAGWAKTVQSQKLGRNLKFVFGINETNMFPVHSHIVYWYISVKFLWDSKLSVGLIRELNYVCLDLFVVYVYDDRLGWVKRDGKVFSNGE